MMVKFQRLFITVVILLGFSASHAEELFVESNGRVRVSTGEFNENGVKTWRYLDRGRGGLGGNMFYHEIQKSLPVVHSSTGARSLEKIPVKFTASVSRAGVLAGVGALVRQGAKLGTRAVPYVGTALLAYDIYKELNPELEKAGYKYSEDIGDYVKHYDKALCLGRFREEPGYYSCLGVDSSELLALDKGGQRAKETQDLLVRRVRSEFERLADQLGKDHGERYLFKDIQWCVYHGNGSVGCYFGKDRLYGLSFELKEKQTDSKPDPNSFNDLIAKKVDENPDKFIKATNFPSYKEDVEVAPGTKLNIGPVTDKSGNPVQVLVSFGRDSQGKTTADVQVTPRPDLTPGSVEAPNVRPLPDTSPATNPSNNPNPSDNPENRPNPEPANGRDGGILCKMFPRILACDEQPEAEEPNLDLPQNTIDLNFQTDNSFQDNGQCPEPVSFQAFGQTFNISLDPICQLALMMRPIIIAMAWLMAAFFVTKTIREEV